MTDLWSYLKNADKPIVLYGTGNGADKVFSRLCADGVPVSGVFSSAGFKKNRTFYGHSVCDYETLKTNLGEMIILVCFGTDCEEVLENIAALSRENEFYVPDVPVYGEDIFDIGFARKNADKLKKVYGMLADETSKRVFENIVYFKLTGKAEYLYKIETDFKEEEKLLCLGPDERFLDLGAFTGDTVAQFVESVGIYNGIFAVEPDSRNYRKLCENTTHLKNITTLNCAVGDADGTVTISKQHGTGIGGTSGVCAVGCTTAETIAKNFAPTFIKIDVEGAEAAVIKGAQNTVRQTKPKMKIACYHNSYDIFDIALLINEIYGGYKIHIRHRRCLPAWDTDFFFIP